MDLKFFPFFNTDAGQDLLDEAKKIKLEELMAMDIITTRVEYVATEIFILSIYGISKYETELKHLQKLRDNFLEEKGVK